MTSSFKATGNQYVQLVMVLHCKLPNISKKLPSFPHILNHQPQRWEASVLPLHHCGPRLVYKDMCDLDVIFNLDSA